MISKQMMFTYGRRILITFRSFSSKTIKSEELAHSAFNIARSFAITGSIAATTLKFINNCRTQKSRNFIFKCEKMNQPALNLEYNLEIAIGEFIFYYMINPSTNLKRQFLKCSTHCVKSVQIRIFFWSAYSVSLRIQSECGKMRTRKKSVFGHFSRSE